MTNAQALFAAVGIVVLQLLNLSVLVVRKRRVGRCLWPHNLVSFTVFATAWALIVRGVVQVFA